jgi:Immunity protein 8
MRAALRDIAFDPDPRSLPAEPEGFAFAVRLLIGPQEGAGEETFTVTVCSPEWLARQCRIAGIVDGRHHVIVEAEAFDERTLRNWLEQWVSSIEAATWGEVAERLGRLGYPESEA